MKQEYRNDRCTEARKEWGPGPWDDEPDKIVWVDEATDLDCMIVRNRMGALCGYVGVPEGHPFFGKDYNKPPVEVHGGLTYDGPCAEPEDPADGICHIAQPGRPEPLHWFGFDCGHFMDLIPRMIALEGDIPGLQEHCTYKGVGYVTKEIEDLAKQLHALARNQAGGASATHTETS